MRGAFPQVLEPWVGGFYVAEGGLWLKEGCLVPLCNAVSALEVLLSPSPRGVLLTVAVDLPVLWWAPQLKVFLTLLHASCRQF